MNSNRRGLAKKSKRGSGRKSASSEARQSELTAALALFQQGRLKQAEKALLHLEERHPGIPDVLHLLGFICLETGRPGPAAEYLEGAVEAVPSSAEMLNLLGIAQHDLGRNGEALKSLEKAVSLQQHHTLARFNLANVLRDLERLEDAATQLEAVVALKPDFADAQYNLGLTRKQLGAPEAAIPCYEAALGLEPDNPETLNSLAAALLALERWDEAEEKLGKAQALAPDMPGIHCNLGILQKARGELIEAERHFRRALDLEPDLAIAHGDLGVTLRVLGRYEEAEISLLRAIELAPDKPDNHTNLALLYLLTGNEEVGWKEYEWRWRQPKFKPRPFPQPLWDGSDLSAKTIICWGDEGVGDEVLFSSQIPGIIQRAAHCIVECAPRLVPMFKRAFPAAEVIPRTDDPDPRLMGHGIDFHSPFTSLVRWTLPKLKAGRRPDAPYLFVDPALGRKLKTRYADFGDALKIGISWASGNRARPERNLPLALWRPILTQPGCRFISLQYGDHATEIAETQEKFGIEIYVDKDVDQLQSLEDFAAQISALDLVITISCTTAHMSGALGQNVWTMLPFATDYRYQLHRTDSPWYPNMRLFRQERAGEWLTAIEQVSRELVLKTERSK